MSTYTNEELHGHTGPDSFHIDLLLRNLVAIMTKIRMFKTVVDDIVVVYDISAEVIGRVAVLVKDDISSNASICFCDAFVAVVAVVVALQHDLQ